MKIVLLSSSSNFSVRCFSNCPATPDFSEVSSCFHFTLTIIVILNNTAPLLLKQFFSVCSIIPIVLRHLTPRPFSFTLTTNATLNNIASLIFKYFSNTSYLSNYRTCLLFLPISNTALNDAAFLLIKYFFSMLCYLNCLVIPDISQVFLFFYYQYNLICFKLSLLFVLLVFRSQILKQ